MLPAVVQAAVLHVGTVNHHLHLVSVVASITRQRAQPVADLPRSHSFLARIAPSIVATVFRRNELLAAPAVTIRVATAAVVDVIGETVAIAMIAGNAW